MKVIKLTRGYVSLVDDEDYKRVNKYHWNICESKKNVFYAVRKSYENKGKTRRHISMSSFIMNSPKGMYVDHINHDTLDNRKKNLRICTLKQNMRNRRKKINNKSGYKGVYRFLQGKEIKQWKAQAKINGLTIFLGYHKTKESAAEAYDIKALKEYGDFAYLNFPDKKEDYLKHLLVLNQEI